MAALGAEQRDRGRQGVEWNPPQIPFVKSRIWGIILTRYFTDIEWGKDDREP